MTRASACWVYALLSAACGDNVIGVRGGPADASTLDPGCGLAAAAFCETFDGASSGGRSGDLDEAAWAVSRWGDVRIRANSTEPEWLGISRWSNPTPTLCEAEFSGVVPPDDVRVCSGQLQMVLRSSAISAMVRQPFDFADGGALVFAVDAKRNEGWNGNGWWLEVWITEDPAPLPSHGAPGIESPPRNGVGIQIIPFNDAFYDPSVNAINGLFVARDHVLVIDEGDGGVEGAVFRVAEGALNHFRVELTPDTVDVYTHDSDQPPDTAHLVYSRAGLGLTFGRGYVHLQQWTRDPGLAVNCPCDTADIVSCACDCDGRCGEYPDGFIASPAVVYRWDDVGFDGPLLAAPRAVDVALSLDDASFDDNGVTVRAVEIGYRTDPTTGLVSLPLVGVTPATRAILTFDAQLGPPGDLLGYRVNDGPWHQTSPPNGTGGGIAMRGFALDLPVEELAPGDNVLEIDAVEPDDEAILANIDLLLYP